MNWRISCCCRFREHAVAVNGPPLQRGDCLFVINVLIQKYTCEADKMNCSYGMWVKYRHTQIPGIINYIMKRNTQRDRETFTARPNIEVVKETVSAVVLQYLIYICICCRSDQRFERKPSEVCLTQSPQHMLIWRTAGVCSASVKCWSNGLFGWFDV